MTARPRICMRPQRIEDAVALRLDWSVSEEKLDVLSEFAHVGIATPPFLIQTGERDCIKIAMKPNASRARSGGPSFADSPLPLGCVRASPLLRIKQRSPGQNFE